MGCLHNIVIISAVSAQGHARRFNPYLPINLFAINTRPFSYHPLQPSRSFLSGWCPLSYVSNVFEIHEQYYDHALKQKIKKLLFMRLFHLVRGVPIFSSSRRTRSRIPYCAPYLAILSFYTQQGNRTKKEKL
ncbi:hypothetical protein BDN70DRAFT_365619 [Pholiota conissans]|uniref:Uncharacterized protein n=1 Tax=Pholiota conissans TaxID=109636 RepID=A0A9P6CZ37_9AGAR|nr:hypothetical protein BDN70DRAFT_365619 [Pholiota conissans]